MLSSYHRMFLQRLNGTSIRYIVVGAQARRHCNGDPGHDLDVWIELTSISRPVILSFLDGWINTHKLHVRPGFKEALPAELRDGLQLKFPEYDGCGYFDGIDGGIVGPTDGIDVLIGGNAVPDFNDCFPRSTVVELDGLMVRCLSPEDDARFPRLATETFKHGDEG